MDRRGFLGRISGAFAAMGLAAAAKASDKIVDAADVVIPPPTGKIDAAVWDALVPAKEQEASAGIAEFTRERMKEPSGIFDRPDPQPHSFGLYHEQAALTWKNGDNSLGVLIQGFDLTFRTPIRSLPGGYAYVEGFQEGLLRGGLLCGPAAVVNAFLEKFGDVKRPAQLVIEPVGYPTLKYTLKHFVLCNVGPTTTAGEQDGAFKIIESPSGMFTSYEAGLQSDG